MPKDLDQSDVQADANEQFSIFLDWVLQHTYNDDTTLMRFRYIYGDSARQGDIHGVLVCQTIDFTRARNHIESCPDLEASFYDENPDDFDYPINDFGRNSNTI